MRKPPPNTGCDCVIEVLYDGGSIRLRRCPNLATVTIKSFPAEAWICQDCADKRSSSALTEKEH
jgi:hypothetical protein